MADTPTTLADLTARADALYDRDAGWRDFLAAFTRPELEALWGTCQRIDAPAFDDEVFDALASLGHFDAATL